MSGNQVHNKAYKINQVIRAITDKVGNDPNISIDYIRQILAEYTLSNELISFVLHAPNQELTLEAASFFIHKFGYNQVEAFIDTFPHLREAIAHLINTHLSTDNFTQLMGELGNLFHLAKLMPECNNVIVNQLLSDTDIFLKYVKNYSLKLLADTYPDYKEQLIRKWLNNDKLSEDFIAFLLQESDLQITREILIYFLSQFTIDERKALMANFPHLPTALNDYLKSDRSAELSLEDKRIVIEGIFQPLLEHHTLDIIILKTLINQFPIFKDVILEKFLNDDDFFLKIAADSHKLEDLAQAFPDRTDSIITKILNNRDLFLELFYFTSQVERLLTSLPHYQAAIAETILSDHKIFNILCSYDHQLSKLQDLFPHYKEKFVRVFKVLKTPLEQLLIDIQDMALFNELNSQLSKDMDFFLNKAFDSNQLTKLATAFPNHAENIITKILNDADLFSKFVESVTSLMELAEAFPGHADFIITKVLNDKEIFLKIFSMPFDVECLLTSFPNYQTAMAETILANHNIFNTLCNHDYKLSQLQRLFPDHKWIFKVLNTSFKELLVDIINTQNIALFKELNRQLKRAPAYSAQEEKLLKEAKEHFLNLSKAQGLDAVLEENTEWQEEKDQFLKHCEREPTLVKRLVGFFKDNPDKEPLENAKETCPNDLKNLLAGPRLSEVLRMA